jgi:hypothetical protein
MPSELPKHHTFSAISAGTYEHKPPLGTHLSSTRAARTTGRLEGRPVCGGAGVMELPWVAPAKGSRTLRTAAAAAAAATATTTTAAGDAMEGKWRRRSLLARTPSRGREQRDAAMWCARHDRQTVTNFTAGPRTGEEVGADAVGADAGTRRRRRRGAPVCRKPRCACRLRTATCRRAARR